MGRPRNKSGIVKISISGAVNPSTESRIESIAIAEDRTKSQVIEKLILRGIAAYDRDESLEERDARERKKAGSIQVIDVDSTHKKKPQKLGQIVSQGEKK